MCLGGFLGCSCQGKGGGGEKKLGKREIGWTDGWAGRRGVIYPPTGDKKLKKIKVISLLG
jgi:hypothetical protein